MYVQDQPYVKERSSMPSLTRVGVLQAQRVPAGEAPVRQLARAGGREQQVVRWDSVSTEPMRVVQDVAPRWQGEVEEVASRRRLQRQRRLCPSAWLQAPDV